MKDAEEGFCAAGSHVVCVLKALEDAQNISRTFMFTAQCLRTSFAVGSARDDDVLPDAMLYQWDTYFHSKLVV